MDNGQPEAVKEAIEWLETSPTTRDKLAAAELRRLHAVNAELIEALSDMVDTYQYEASPYNESLLKAKAALAKANGGKNG